MSTFLFQQSAFYGCPEVNLPFTNEIKNYLVSGGSIFKVAKSCEKFHKQNLKIIQSLIKEKNLTLKLTKLADILSLSISFIWLAHGFEDIYEEKLRKEVLKYFKCDIEKIIGELSYPTKKNAHSYLEKALVDNVPLEKIQKKYGWIKCRDGLSSGFSIKELKDLKKKLLSQKKVTPPKIKVPQGLKKLINEARELVFYRTYRSDVLYELMFSARPILQEAADKYQMKLTDLRDYSIYDLIKNKPKKYPANPSLISYNGEAAIFNKTVFVEKNVVNQLIIGRIAYPGVAKGIVKIVKEVSEINKVKKGDILVTQMTFPNLLMAMQKAAAFVTDEGGITCHAAIVAREMQKPCIIGTKIATRVLKDGDFIEVDAVRGIVSRLRLRSIRKIK